MRALGPWANWGKCRNAEGLGAGLYLLADAFKPGPHGGAHVAFSSDGLIGVIVPDKGAGMRGISRNISDIIEGAGRACAIFRVWGGWRCAPWGSGAPSGLCLLLAKPGQGPGRAPMGEL